MNAEDRSPRPIRRTPLAVRPATWKLEKGFDSFPRGCRLSPFLRQASNHLHWCQRFSTLSCSSLCWFIRRIFRGPNERDLDRRALALWALHTRVSVFSAVHHLSFFLCPLCPPTLTLNHRTYFPSCVLISFTSGYSHDFFSASNCLSKPLQNRVSYCHTYEAYAY